MKLKLPVYHFSLVVALLIAVLATLLLVLTSCSSTPEPYGDWRDFNEVDWSPGADPIYRLDLGEPK